MAGSLFEAYVSGQARAFFSANFQSAHDRQKAVARAARALLPDVHAALSSQQARLGASSARSRHLEQLARGAAAVVTGQQVGLFLGPLYTLYKAASAIQLARMLAAESGKTVVPIFWLQTEDHDLPEIAACHVLSAARAALRLELPAAADNRVSIAHLTLPPDIEGCLHEIERALSGLPYAREHLARLRCHYRSSASWADAFAGLLAELFEPEGLLIIDPRDPALAQRARSVHERALTQAESIADALEEQCVRLTAAGFAPAVHVRQRAPLSFYHPDGPGGPRCRLTASGTGFNELGGTRSFERQQLMAALATEPLRFSTSALLRPLLQDSLLPTAAYVGGPAEIAYFAQLSPLYAAYGIEPPIVVPRARLRVIDAASGTLLNRLGLEASALSQREEVLLRALSERASAYRAEPDPPQFEQRLVQRFERALRETLSELGPHAAELESASAKTRAKLQLTASKLAERYASVLARADQARVQDLQSLRRWLYPNDQPQERVYGMSHFGAEVGDRKFVEAVLETIVPCEARELELRL